MISVQNHPLQLSGNKIWVAALVALCLASCTTKKSTVLRSPSSGHGEQQTAVTKPPVDKESTITKMGDTQRVNGYAVKNNRIALLLPFELSNIAGTVKKEDVERSSLALDFYQGFQLGLDKIAKEGALFDLQVIDSRDNVAYNATLGTAVNVKDAVLVVGPVYPREIKSFGQTFANKNVLQVSPLAATMASEFSLPNLVSITPSIRTHAETLAKYVAEQYYNGDQIVIYDAGDDDSKQFLINFANEITKANPQAKVKTVMSINELNNSLVLAGTNHIISGTANKNLVKGLLDAMDERFLNPGNQFKLYGHPNMAKLSFENFENMDFYALTITSSNLVDETDGDTKKFIGNYKAAYKVDPSEFSYKGYDAALYFGRLIHQYGVDYVSRMTQEKFSGLNSDYRFEFYPKWGYANRSLGMLVYHDKKFERK
ncbi:MULTISPECIES: ABC transporter substrate-binding protein [Sphingobacterium]|uniref:ABC-type branched-subunit amino acid transport system substrate-binding protein n=1 Tax=Sphingobacterium zeae TaxID=1776859 RepID=A0ABU0U679_9SPHI|nr:MULTISPECIES: ABC transporter substrate-binding protein [Sphingobacterium]MDQ1150439.1 ABC-type branched-subunit amino acid transport system substrate-binding protein [Sphingobacterium zeae]